MRALTAIPSTCFAMAALASSAAASADPVLEFKSAVSAAVTTCAEAGQGDKSLTEHAQICAGTIEAVQDLRELHRPKFRFAENQVWADAFVQQKYGLLHILIAQKHFQAADHTLDRPTCEQFALARQHFSAIPDVAKEKGWFGKADYDLRALAERMSAQCAGVAAD